jgi:hypothetical protein
VNEAHHSPVPYELGIWITGTFHNNPPRLLQRTLANTGDMMSSLTAIPHTATMSPADTSSTGTRLKLSYTNSSVTCTGTGQETVQSLAPGPVSAAPTSLAIHLMHILPVHPGVLGRAAGGGHSKMALSSLLPCCLTLDLRTDLGSREEQMETWVD